MDRATTTSPSTVGNLFRYWRDARRKSQLALATEAEMSPRHLCFLETGRARPSREMVLRLAEVLDVPLRERNAMLIAAGFQAHYKALDLDAPELAPARAALDAILKQHEPFPAIVMNRHWDIVRSNDAAGRFFTWLLDGRAPDGAPNLLRAMFRPGGLRPRVQNWPDVAESLIRRLHREAVGGVVDDAGAALLDELLRLPGVDRAWRLPREDLQPIVPVTFEKDGRVFRYFSAVTTLGTPQDVTLQELRIEALFPLDDATRAEVKKLNLG